MADETKQEDTKTGDESKTGDNTSTKDGDESSGTGATGSATSSETGSQSSSESDSELSSEAKAKIATANSEAAKYRRELRTAQKALDDAKSKDLSDLEREKKRADDAEAKVSKADERLQEANLRIAISQSDLSIVDVETASLLLRKQGVEFDEDGEPKDIETALKTLTDSKPFLLGTEEKPKPKSKGSTNGGAGTGDEGNGGVTLTAEELEIAKAFKMTPEDYAKNKDRK